MRNSNHYTSAQISKTWIIPNVPSHLQKADFFFFTYRELWCITYSILLCFNVINIVLLVLTSKMPETKKCDQRRPEQVISWSCETWRRILQLSLLGNLWSSNLSHHHKYWLGNGSWMGLGLLNKSSSSVSISVFWWQVLSNFCF